MKAKIMLLKVVAVLAICTAIPHGVAYWQKSKSEESILVDDSTQKMQKSHKKVAASNGKFHDKNVVENQNALIGFWEVQYRDPTVKVVYEFKEEQGVTKGYSVQLEDENGNTMLDNTLTILVNSIADKTAKAKYFIEYEGEKYEVNCKLKIVADQLILTYSYFGFDEKEVWHKTTRP